MMKMSGHARIVLLWAAALVAALPGAVRSHSAQTPATAKGYELRISTATPGRLADLKMLFRDRAARLERHGIEPVFSGTVLEGAASDGDRAVNMLVDILAHESRAAVDRSWAALDADTEWRAARSAAEKSGPLAGAPASTVMNLTDFSPALVHPAASASDAPRVFELRQYNTGAEDLDYTVERFRLGLAKVIGDAGMTPLAYWTADDRSAFIYLVAHKDREAARTSWTNFMPGYRAFMTKYNADRGGPSTPPSRRSPDDNRMLVPTDYSPIR
jgi:NIPSNAP